jgi:hypothetical protein
VVVMVNLIENPSFEKGFESWEKFQPKPRDATSELNIVENAGGSRG